jgi:DNA-binding transcriptional MocR family regulator
MSLSRRLALLEWAQRVGAWILEDDYDSEYRYIGRPLPALQGLDKENRTVYLGTLSKTLFPSLRLGYLVVPPDLVDAFVAAKALADRHARSVEQAVLAAFIMDGHFDRHIRRTRLLYAERQAALVDAAAKYLGGLLEVRPAEAGMHLIGYLPEGKDDLLARGWQQPTEWIHRRCLPIRLYRSKPAACCLGTLLSATRKSRKEYADLLWHCAVIRKPMARMHNSLTHASAYTTIS